MPYGYLFLQEICPFSKSEVAAYIGHQMELTGTNHPIFSENAIEAITTVSPRMASLDQQSDFYQLSLWLPKRISAD